jgi:hypothetical protein
VIVWLPGGVGAEGELVEEREGGSSGAKGRDLAGVGDRKELARELEGELEGAGAELEGGVISAVRA